MADYGASAASGTSTQNSLEYTYNALAAFLASLLNGATVITSDMPAVVKRATDEAVNGLEKFFHEKSIA